MKITGTFKDYDGLIQSFGTDVTREIDETFNGFLKKIADQECILVSYNPLNKTFDATLMVPDPENPGNKVQEIPYGILRGYTRNLGLNTLVDGSITCGKCTEHIYCTGCGYQVGKDIRYDYEPRFTYGDVFNGDCTENDQNNISGQTIAFNACDSQGRIFCPNCRTYEFFDEIANTIP
jgi:hypothetical protein